MAIAISEQKDEVAFLSHRYKLMQKELIDEGHSPLKCGEVQSVAKVTTVKSICITARRFPRIIVILGVIESPSSPSMMASRQSRRLPPENTITDSLPKKIRFPQKLIFNFKANNYSLIRVGDLLCLKYNYFILLLYGLFGNIWFAK